MIRLSTVLTLTVIFITAGCSQENIEFSITNNSEIDRTDEPIVLSRQTINQKSSIPDDKIPLPYINNEAIPAQLDDIDLDGEWDELAFTLNISAAERKQVQIRMVDEDDYPQFTQKTNVRFGVKDNSEVEAVEELTMTADELPVSAFERFQMDGPAWENDKIGFRQYIDGRNGRDVYGKTTPEMALDTVGISGDGGLEDNYHVMLPWGRDILAVGHSLGLGGLAIIQNGEPKRLGVRIDAERNNVDTTRYQLITEGPVRSIFRLTYSGWDTGNRKVDLVNDVTIWAGTYGHQNSVSLSSTEASDTLVVGLVNIHNDNPPSLIEDVDPTYTALITHDQQTYDKEWYLGMAVIFPSEHFLEYQEAPDSGPGVINSYLNLFELGDDKTLTYYVFSGWELSDENFKDADYFSDMIAQEIQKIATSVIIE